MSKYLSESLERVQKRAMNIILSSLSYEAALINAGIATLESRRIDLCKRYMSNLDLDHPVRKLAHSRTLSVQHDYCTRIRPLRIRTETHKG